MNLTEIQKNVLEQLINESVVDDNIYEMANIHPRYHGIDNVVIWVGMKNERHGLRVKVSNKKDKFDPIDNFPIHMPSLDYPYDKVAKWITPTKMEEIFNWIKLNQQLLNDYENGLIDDTGLFLDNLVKI
jgi:hypothetical protein